MMDPYVPRPDGWYSFAELFWDLWLDNDNVASICKSARRWTGYVGNAPYIKRFTSAEEDSCSPLDIKNQIMDYLEGAKRETA